MSTEVNKAIVRRLWEEACNQGHFDINDEVFAPDFVYKGAATGWWTDNIRGPENYRQGAKVWQAAVPISCSPSNR